MLSITDINEYMTGIFMYHCMNQKAPEFFCLFFKTNRACHNRDTRQSDDLNVPSWRLDVRKFGFRVHGANGITFLTT